MPGGGLVTAENMRLDGPLGHLYGHLLARGWLVPIAAAPAAVPRTPA